MRAPGLFLSQPAMAIRPSIWWLPQPIWMQRAISSREGSE